jgi:thiol-disulfide isomerase/thioredoxin
MKIILLLIAVVCSTVATRGQEYSVKINQPERYNITAHLTGIEDGTLFYIYDPVNQLALDSAVLDHGMLKFNGHFNILYPHILWLKTADWKLLSTLLIGNETVFIEGDKKDFPYYLHVTGSSAYDVFNILNKQTRDYWVERSKVVDTLMPLTQRADAESDSVHARIKVLAKRMQQSDVITDSLAFAFVKKYANSYAGVLSLSDLKGKLPRDTVKKYWARITPKYRATTWGDAIAVYLITGKTVMKGDHYADFSAKDSSGHVHHLSEIKGRYILLDFTATYCGPCIASLAELRTVANKYKDSLSVVTYWTDESRKVWMEGYRRDQQEWLSLWDGSKTRLQTLAKYSIYSNPQFFLIDPKGIVVSHWEGYGKDQFNSLADILK